ncbi:MAG: aldehyde dehydrogenase family protein, partial [Limnochordales bacterium]
LKSDVKLSIAKAYLGYMMKRDEKLCVHTEDLPDYVRRGLLKYREAKDEIDRFITGDIVSFSAAPFSPVVQQDRRIFNFYEALEEKRKALEQKGLSESDIKLIMSIDIETYLKKYVLNFNSNNREELYKVVDKRIVDMVSDFLNYASKTLGRPFSEKTLYGLSMHVSSSIERIRSGKDIVNNQLEDIKKVYEKEFEVANFLREKIEKQFKIKVPEDEVGFVAMFLCLEEEVTEKDERVGIVVAMHGEAAATSIADVSNRLLGEDYVIGYNMPLDQKPEVALENLTEIVKRANRGKGVLLERGGKNAITVMDDADLDLAVQGILWSAFGTSGQRCTAASRLIVHRKVIGELTERLVAGAQQLRLGNPLDETTQVGPIVNEKQLQRVHRYTGVGIEEGARLLCGGEIYREGDCAKGYFYRPTLFADVHPRMRIAQEEIFGPTAVIIPCDSLEEAIEINNDTPYGLSSSIYTRDVNRAMQAARDLTTGIVYINHGTTGAEVHLPFGGTRGTGNGHREAAVQALDAFTEWKSIYIDYSGRLQRAQIDTPSA